MPKVKIKSYLKILHGNFALRTRVIGFPLVRQMTYNEFLSLTTGWRRRRSKWKIYSFFPFFSFLGVGMGEGVKKIDRRIEDRERGKVRKIWFLTFPYTFISFFSLFLEVGIEEKSEAWDTGSGEGGEKKYSLFFPIFPFLYSEVEMGVKSEALGWRM